jgi:M6 family metalloprotease-like protein
MENQPVSLTQPDKTIIKALLSGDEFHSWYHDESNYTIIQDPKSGYWCWAIIKSDELVSSGYPVHKYTAKNLGIMPEINISDEKYYEMKLGFYNESYRTGGLTPTTGNVTNIVIFVKFYDEDDYEFDEPLSFWENLYNATGTSVNSLKQYFWDASYRTLNLTSYLYPISNSTTVVAYQDFRQRDHYLPILQSPYGYTTPDDMNRRMFELVQSAVNSIAGTVDPTIIVDSNNNGNVDNVTLVIRGEATGGILWSRYGQLYDPNLKINNKLVRDFNIIIEQQVEHWDFGGVGLLVHELGHSFGIPDLSVGGGHAFKPVGHWDVMSNQLNVPQSFSAYSKSHYLGWTPDIPTITESGTYTLKPITVCKYNHAYRVNSPMNTLEYFIIEYRSTFTGTTDSTLIDLTGVGAGLLVYRVNTLFSANTPYSQRLYVYRPNGTYSVVSDPATYGNVWHAFFSADAGKTEFNDTTNPSAFLSRGDFGGLYISNISAVGDSITFDVSIMPEVVTEFPYIETFEKLPSYWSLGAGRLLEYPNLTKPNLDQGPSWSGGLWNLRYFLNDPYHPNGSSARGGLSHRFGRWLITPMLDLSRTSGYHTLSFDIGMIVNFPEFMAACSTASLIVLVSNEGGEYWSDKNILAKWDNTTSFRVIENISTIGERITLSLSEYSGQVKIAFILRSDSMRDGVFSIYIDNVTVRYHPPNININRGGAFLTGFSTIQEAIYETMEGDIITVRPLGHDIPHTGPGNTNLMMPTAHAITIRGAGYPHGPVIDCGGETGFIFGTSSHVSRIENLTITNSTEAIRITNSAPIIDNVLFSSNSRDINIDNIDSIQGAVTIESCVFTDNLVSGSGSTSILASAPNLIIRDSRFSDIQGRAISFSGRSIDLENSRFEGITAFDAPIFLSNPNSILLSAATIRDNLFVGNRTTGTGPTSFNAHNLFIDRAFRFGVVDIKRNVFDIPAGVIVSHPSIAINNYDRAGVVASPLAHFRYNNNTTLSASPGSRDILYTVGTPNEDYRFLIQNSVFAGDLLLSYVRVMADFPNNVIIRNSWFESEESIRGGTVQINDPIICYIAQVTDLLFGSDPQITPTTYRPIWDATVKSPLIDAGYHDTNEDGILWYEDIEDQSPDGTRLDIGAIASLSHGATVYRIKADSSPSKFREMYHWVCFPYIDKLYQGGFLIDGHLYAADDLIYNLHHYQGNSFFSFDSSVSWRYNDYVGTINNQSFAQTPSHHIDSRYGYKMFSYRPPNLLPLFHDIYNPTIVAGFYLGSPNPPINSTQITLSAVEQGEPYRETWVGYFKHSSAHPLHALSQVTSHLIEIKTRHWSLNKVGNAWIVSGAEPMINFGEAVSLKYTGDIDRTFTWQSPPHPPENQYSHPLPIYFEYVEEEDYLPLYVYIPYDIVNEGGGEIGLFIDAICYGAEVIQGDIVQINAYILGAGIDLDDADIELRIHEYIPRSLAFGEGAEPPNKSHRVKTSSYTPSAVASHISPTSDGSKKSARKLFYQASLRSDDPADDIISYVTQLEGNYPNPFNPITTILYSLAGPEFVSIKIYNIKGQLVYTLVHEPQKPGRHTAIWDGVDHTGRGVSSGIYFYRFQTSSVTTTKKMLLIK